MKLKGYAMTQVLCEAVIIMLLAGAFYKTSSNLISLSKAADVKAVSLARNISVMEIIKSLAEQGMDIDSLADFTLKNGFYITKITSMEAVHAGFPALYRISVGTEYKGNYLAETELVSYITVY